MLKTAGLRLAHLAIVGSAALLASGCSDDMPPKTPELPPAAATPRPKRTDTKNETSGSVSIDNKIISACGDLPTARFAFDSADVQPDAATALDALARCFVSGPLKGKGMKLIGYADPRGETEYNLALGQKRAGSIGELLARKGVESGKMATSSKGEFEATGTDEEGWARDRKVEVLLAD